MLKPHLAALALTGLLACADRPSGASRGGPSRDEGAAESPAISCTTSADCPVLACGPCEPGKVITKAHLAGPQCHRNPCKNPGSTCNAKHVCVISAGVEKDPAVFGTAAPAR